MIKGVMSWFKTRLITGVIVIAPLALTIWILTTVFRKLDSLLAEFIHRFAGRELPGAGFVALILLILIIGTVARNFIGGKLISLGNMVMTRIPIVRRIYTAIQQITHVFLGEQKTIFQKVVVFEYPREGSYVLGFVTGRKSGEIGSRLGEKLVNIFLPTTPNPTSGYLLFVPEKDVIFLDMSVEDGIKMVISGGAFVPPHEPEEVIQGAEQ